MHFVDRLRIRRVIALIAILPMLVGAVAVGLLAIGESRARSEAVQELDDLEVLLVVREMQSGLAAEIAFYEGWFSLVSATDRLDTNGLVSPAVRATISAGVRPLGDSAMAAVEGADVSATHREQLDTLIGHWLKMREAFDRDDVAAVQVEVAELGVASDTLEAIADELVARQGAPWLPVDRQSRFGVTLAEEMSFTGVLLMSGGTSETDRVRAAVLADRSILAFDAMMAVSTTDQRERLQSVADAAQINALRRQAQLETMTLANNEVITALVQLADVTSVVNDVRSESAETIRATAADKAALASTKRDLALALVVAVVVAPLALLVTVGGRLSRRLEVLAEAARRVADGEMDMRIADTSGRDEVAEVSVAFNDVAETIARSHDQISALAEGRIDDPILDDELPGVIGQTLRLALRRLGNATAELAHQANHDKLTGLLDRRGLQAGLDSLVARDADGVPVDRGMILVDLDDFKQINDVHGHAAGDAVLREVAKRLVAGTRSGDLVARLGGDEFLVLTSSHSSCEATVDRLAEHIAMPIEWSGLMLPVTASIGWTSIGVDEHFEDVLHRADKAMYTAKRSGKNQSLSSER